MVSGDSEGIPARHEGLIAHSLSASSLQAASAGIPGAIAVLVVFIHPKQALGVHAKLSGPPPVPEFLESESLFGSLFAITWFRPKNK